MNSNIRNVIILTVVIIAIIIISITLLFNSFEYDEDDTDEELVIIPPNRDRDRRIGKPSFEKLLQQCSDERKFLIKYSDREFECMSSFNILYPYTVMGYTLYDINVRFESFVEDINTQLFYVNFLPNENVNLDIKSKLPSTALLNDRIIQIRYLSMNQSITTYSCQGLILENVFYNNIYYDVYFPKVCVDYNEGNEPKPIISRCPNGKFW